jgi:hypothetical protein
MLKRRGRCTKHYKKPVLLNSRGRGKCLASLAPSANGNANFDLKKINVQALNVYFMMTILLIVLFNSTKMS